MDDNTEDWTGDPAEQEDQEDQESKSLTNVAKEVLAGEWGSGQERRLALANAGFDPNKVKAEMVRIVNET